MGTSGGAWSCLQVAGKREVVLPSPALMLIAYWWSGTSPVWQEHVGDMAVITRGNWRSLLGR